MDMVMETSYVEIMILETVWLEKKGEGPVSSFTLTVILYHIPENMTGTDQDNTEINSRLLVSFCCANSVVACLYLANYGKLWQKFSPFG
jgi:hypothetical protein